MSDDKNTPPSKGRRFFKLAKMTASVAGSYTSSRIKSVFQSDEDKERSREETQRKNGERVAETLGNLKGAAMKIGQMASVATDLLPAELAKPLEKLQNDAPPMDYSVIADQIEAELGARPEMLFDDFDEESFASASIGQVHRAVSDDGRDVVVKVQYPGVDSSVSSDLGQLKMALKLSGFVSRGRKKAFDLMFDEIEERLHEELDYCNEADNVRLFRKLHADDDFVILPEVVGERSAKRVLTLTEVPGDSLEEACAEYTFKQRDAVGASLMRLLGTQMFQYGTLHADPNPANFAFRPDGRVVLYDFGCVKRMTELQQRSIAGIIESSLDRDYAGVEEHLLAMGARIPDKPALPDEVYAKWRHIFLEPILDHEYYDYGDGVIYERVRENMKTFIDHEEWFQPPPGGVYVDRTTVGVHNILRRLQARVPCQKLLRGFLETAREEQLEPA